MGRYAILLVLFAILGSNYATVSRNETSYNVNLTQGDYEEKVLARETAESALEMIVGKVKAVRREQMRIGKSQFLANYDMSLMNKVYRDALYETRTTQKIPGEIDVFAKGTLGINEYSINAKINFKYGRALDAITLDGDDEKISINATNKMSISGIDRKTDGFNKFLGSDGDGMNVHGASVRSERSFKNFFDDAEPHQVEGMMGEGDVVNDTPKLDLGLLAKEIEAYGGTNRLTFEGRGSMDKKKDLGSQKEPAITVVNGDFWMKNQSKGYGVLLVNGDLNIDAGSRFEGLILVMGANRKINIAGNVEIYGSLAVHFEDESDKAATEITIAGDTRVQYSSEALLRVGEFIGSLSMENNTELVVTRVNESASRKDGHTALKRNY